MPYVWSNKMKLWRKMGNKTFSNILENGEDKKITVTGRMYKRMNPVINSREPNKLLAKLLNFIPKYEYPKKIKKDGV